MSVEGPRYELGGGHAEAVALLQVYPELNKCAFQLGATVLFQ